MICGGGIPLAVQVSMNVPETGTATLTGGSTIGTEGGTEGRVVEGKITQLLLWPTRGIVQ